MYLIYCEKIPSNQQKRYRAIVRLLGIFWATIRQVLSVWLPNGRKTLLKCFISDNSLAVVGQCRRACRVSSQQFECKE